MIRAETRLKASNSAFWLDNLHSFEVNIVVGAVLKVHVSAAIAAYSLLSH